MMDDSDSDTNFDVTANKVSRILDDDSSDEDLVGNAAKLYKQNIAKHQLSSADDSDEDHARKPNNETDVDFTQEDVFGSDTDEEDKDIKNAVIRASNDSDNPDPEANVSYQRNLEPSQEIETDVGVNEDTGISVDFPVIKADLGDEMHLVKLPNFLSVETRPFDPMYYEDELDEDEVQDEEGRTRLKLKVENTIRWRFARDAEGQQVLDEYGQPVRESNARMVRWSDGSLSLHLGREIFDVHSMDISQDHNHLFVRQGSGLQAQAVFKSKLAFRPHSTDSFTHRKLTLSLADKTHKASKVKLLPFAGENPDVKQQEMLRREEERIKSSIKRENQRRRMREKASQRELTAAFLEQQREDELNPHAVSLSDIKKKANKSSGGNGSKRKSRFIQDMSSTEDEDEESLSDLSDKPPKKKVQRKTRIVSDEDSFSE